MRKNLFLVLQLVLILIGGILITVVMPFLGHPVLILGLVFLFLALVTSKKHARDRRNFFIFGTVVSILGFIFFRSHL